MNRNLILKEIRRNISSLIIWMIIITGLISVTMSVYQTFISNQAKVSGMLSLIPKSALQFKGISDFNDLLSVLGFYAVNNVIYMMVLGSVYSIVLGSGILLKEEYNRTAEYLITRPMTRSELFLSKLAVLILDIFLLNLVTTAAGLISIGLVKTGPFSLSAFFILSLYTFLLNILFGSAGLFLSVLVRRPKPITFQCIGLVLILYFVYTISKISGNASAIGYLSPFRYVDMNVVDKTYHLDYLRLIYFAGISSLLVCLSWVIYKRKDIYI